jgi:hypothetical protein
MSLKKKTNPYHLLILAETKKLCGPPPVLSTESVEAYNTMLLRLIESMAQRLHRAAVLQAHSGLHVGNHPLHPPQNVAHGTQVSPSS